MRILLVSTLKRKVTASETASRSQIIYRLAYGLAKKGHKVSLLGTADSKIEGVETIGMQDKGWVDLPSSENQFFRDIASLISLSQKVKEIQKDFDIIHNHTYPEFFLPIIENELEEPLITTIHSQATDYIDDVLSKFRKTKFVALSKTHKKGFKKTKIYSTVYNGIDTSKFPYSSSKKDNLLWVGRLSKAKNKDGSFMDPKGVGWAIELAKKTDSKLKRCGNVEDTQFYKRDVEPYLNDKIEWIGPISSQQPLSAGEVSKLMQEAKAFLATINWEEPFGLSMVEAMASGTPVIGFDKGAVAEIVLDGKTGIVVPYKEGLGGLKKALSKINQINPKDCRRHVEENFTSDRMVNEYEKLYQQMVSE